MKKHTITLGAHEAVIVSSDGAGVAIELHAFGLCLARRALTRDQAGLLSDALGFAVNDVTAAPARTIEVGGNQGRGNPPARA